MLLPLIFIFFATLASAVMAYGTHPSWARYGHGLELILWTRTFQWPLVAFVLVMCLALLALVVSGKRRAWWLIGLAPVMALFAHRFHANPHGRFAVVEFPQPVKVFDEPLNGDDWVVGLTLDGETYLLPYRNLFDSPVVLIQQREKKWIVLWSAWANRAVAFAVDRDVRARDLEVVSTPANSILVYNSRLGEFIVGVTGREPDGSVPRGFRAQVPTVKTTAGAWLAAHPRSWILLARRDNTGNPSRPILPQFPMPAGVALSLDPLTRIAVVDGKNPAAFAASAVGETPINFSFGDEPVLLIRDPALRVFDRRVDEDLFVKLKPTKVPKKPAAVFVDDSTGALWSRNCVAIEGGPEIKGKKLQRLLVEEDLYWGVMKYWYRDLQLYQPK